MAFDSNKLFLVQGVPVRKIEVSSSSLLYQNSVLVGVIVVFLGNDDVLSSIFGTHCILLDFSLVIFVVPWLQGFLFFLQCKTYTSLNTAFPLEIAVEVGCIPRLLHR